MELGIGPIQKGCEPDIAICDFCVHYDYNGEGPKGTWYVGKGRCEHPEHPHDAAPESRACEDFRCELCNP